ncbi:MSMEG_0570 family nitrogen starvation response protein [soil metagenome]
MPEMTFSVRWPDGRLEHCYSPSLVMHDHLATDTTYTVGDFLKRSTRALDIASSRVMEKFGFACTSAAATSDAITRSAAAYESDALVEVVRMWPPVEGDPAQMEKPS